MGKTEQNINYEESWDALQTYIHRSRYARYLPEHQRRETWEETVSRWHNFWSEQTNKAGIVSLRDELETARQSILSCEVMPSMRSLMTAGPALERDHVAGYNCAYTAIDNPRVFDEIMYILMCGTGVGFSVERQYINKLPEIAEEFYAVETTISIADSKIGWASAFRQYISLLYQGQVPQLDSSKIRPSGSILRTFGGRASGPEPLEDLCQFTERMFRKAKGRRLNSLETHDLVCKIASCIVCGGVRRSALLSLSNLTDDRMRQAKTGEWYFAEPQRALANNSVSYTEKPDLSIFLKEWTNLYESKSGERGIFNRVAAQKEVPERRERDFDFGTNPCSEIILRSKQFCNLTEVVIRPSDTLNTLKEKVRVATFIGTMQATLTDFRYLGKQWKRNTEEERLLGVSLTGIMDHATLNKTTPTAARWFSKLQRVALETNRQWADKFNIPRSTAITCVKPSGTVSQLVNSASGIHPRYAQTYIRRIRGDIKDPLNTALQEAGVPCEIDVHNPGVYVFSFPVKAPDRAVCVSDVSAIEQLEHWKMVDEHWCEHKPSVSIYVKEHEWLDVASWVYKNFDRMSGVSFFPYDDHIYQQAPYEEICNQAFKRLENKFKNRNLLDVFQSLSESEDNTISSQELACTGGQCEL